MSAQALQGLRSQIPTEHHATFDAEMAKLDAQGQGSIITFIQALKAFLATLGLSISWGCLLGIFPQIIAAFANPALWLAVFTAYLACAHPPTP